MDELDKILSKRVTPQAAPELAARIINVTAPGKQQIKKPGFFNFLKLPQPAYALGFCFAIVLAGIIYMNTPQSFSSGADDAMEEIGLYMVYDTLSDADFS